MTSSMPTLLIKSDVSAKVGVRADGSISFNILTDENHMEIYLAITGNQGGSGYFSSLPTAFSAIQDCIAGIPADQVIIAKTFKHAAFSVSRNANGPGFIAAILRGIGLLGPAADAPSRHGDWSAWKQEQLRAPAGRCW